MTPEQYLQWHGIPLLPPFILFTSPPADMAIDPKPPVKTDLIVDETRPVRE